MITGGITPIVFIESGVFHEILNIPGNNIKNNQIISQIITKKYPKSITKTSPTKSPKNKQKKSQKTPKKSQKFFAKNHYITMLVNTENLNITHSTT